MSKDEMRRLKPAALDKNRQSLIALQTSSDDKPTHPADRVKERVSLQVALLDLKKKSKRKTPTHSSKL